MLKKYNYSSTMGVCNFLAGEIPVRQIVLETPMRDRLSAGFPPITGGETCGEHLKVKRSRSVKNNSQRAL